MRRWYQHLPLRGTVVENESMARHCSWRTGGAAERYFEPADSDDLALYLQASPSDEQFAWVGLGSNLLVRDGGLAGTVVSTAKTFNGLRWEESGVVFAECGVACAKLSRQAATRGLAAAGFLAGIPGTVGGALAMNAGAFGHEIWEFVRNVRVIDRRGRRQWRSSTVYETSYRSVRGPDSNWFLEAELAFPIAEDGDGSDEIRRLLQQRNEAQPIGQASCGSVFKNPPGDFAGRLIDAAGLKGYRVGGCHISNKHANFIINDDLATAAEIEALIHSVQRTVKENFGIELETEVRIMGSAAGGAGRTER